MVKGDTELKQFQSMLKYNDLNNDFFVAPGLSGSVIVFVWDIFLEVRPYVFKIPCDKPWAWPEVKFWNNPI